MASEITDSGSPASRHEVIDGCEVISCHPDDADPPNRPPILMVHGICHGAWCWEDNFLPFFATHGWSSYAVSLRGHHRGAAAADVKGYAVDHYVEDVIAVADRLHRPPVLIGHSMGGMVVQKYLEDHQAPAAVLLASMPPQGALRSPVIRRHPHVLMHGLVKRSVRTLVSTPERCRALFFSNHTADDVVAQCLSRLTEESNRVILDLLRYGTRRRPARLTTPMLVVGAREDGLFSTSQVERTAALYGADTVILSGTGHNVMLEPTWRQAAEYVESWLRRRLNDDQAG
ncbi:MAG: alpha/beta hydrolase [Mycobacterium sp.]